MRLWKLLLEHIHKGILPHPHCVQKLEQALHQQPQFEPAAAAPVSFLDSRSILLSTSTICCAWATRFRICFSPPCKESLIHGHFSHPLLNIDYPANHVHFECFARRQRPWPSEDGPGDDGSGVSRKAICISGSVNVQVYGCVWFVVWELRWTAFRLGYD